ncbi:28S ribosomal protein S30, mitochondrial, partial [Operophtera brumata]
MNLARLRRSVPKLKNAYSRRSSQVAVLEQDEYTETPEYPPILDMSLEGRKKRERESLFTKIRELNTVEEKQIALNMPRYYGWKSVMLREDKIPYNALPLVQCYTRSHFIPSEKLPETYSEPGRLQFADDVVKEVKGQIEDAIAFELDGVERNIVLRPEQTEEAQKEDAQAACIVRQINRIVINNLSDKLPHILSTQVDFEPRHEAFWFVGGTDVPGSVLAWRNKYKWKKERLYEPVDKPVQYTGTPLIALRNRLPLKPLLPYSEAENPDFKVPKFSHIPKAVGYFEEHASYGPEDNLEALHCQAMKASFGWLLAQANSQGFTTYNDVTYPLVAQTVITNGQLWS